MSDLRSLPSVDSLLQTSTVSGWVPLYGRNLVLGALRQALEEARQAYSRTGAIPDEAGLLAAASGFLQYWVQPTLLPVINATGVILHTNLGRAPLSQAALQATLEAAQGYTNLEYDLRKGRRGSRLEHAEALLCRLCGAEAALVVNNNAAAVLLALTALARRRGVVISRSQLVEIGGGFRVPDVMRQSGARLLEVGATNRVRLEDYAEALSLEPALVLRAHRSNFRIIGFTEEPGLAQIVALAHQAGVPVVDDLGSGSLLDTAAYGLEHEPTVQESLQAGVDLVCFSGDKLLGGPQAGIVVGRADLAGKLKKHPLMRAVRADKLALGALSATLLHYLKGEAEWEVPVWRMIAMPLEEIAKRAESWAQRLASTGVTCQVIPGESTVGGGSLPGETLPTCLLAVQARQADRFLARLRQASPPVIARILNDLPAFDPRTVLPGQEDHLLDHIQAALGK
ncbi:MAG: L-seryl-tRNA(Sec) selenium transferase [Anaerolineales bacterium]|nr:L-seryl-tRNA(Sec) selenium transferase [Anaerolineales bacterium]